ncbi:MAG: DUF4249 domain-containing protein, partial [Bacteroidota bacterium]
ILMKKILIIFSLFTLFNCEQEIPPILPEFENRIVANSFIRPDTTIAVFLSNNISVLSNGVPSGITNASIELYENDIFIGSFSETILEHSDNSHSSSGEPYRPVEGVYLMDHIPQPANTYRIEIQHSGYPQTSATTIIPTVQSEFEISLSEPIILSYDPDYPDEPTYIRYTATVNIDDALGKNYYEIAVFGEGNSRIGFDDDGNKLYRKDLFQIDYNSDDLLFEEGNNPAFLGDAGEVFSDDLFNNQKFKLQITFDIQVGAQAQSFGADGREVLASWERFFIEVRSLSEEYYQYQYTSSLHKTITEDPFAEPVQVFSNVENGLGIFSWYNIETFEFSLEEFIPEP